MNNEVLFSGVRTLIQALCMFALGRGWIKPDDIPGLVAIGVAAATVGYGLYARRNTALVASAAAVPAVLSIVTDHVTAAAVPNDKVQPAVA